MSVNFGDDRLPSRFWDKTTPEPNSGCWLWTAHTASGYGKYGINGTSRRAHRVAFEALIGPIAAGLQLDHLCRTRCCVNPAHLEPVTQTVNVLRGVGPSAIHARKTHCPQGHAYDAANTRITPRGSRGCKACRKPHKRAA